MDTTIKISINFARYKNKSLTFTLNTPLYGNYFKQILMPLYNKEKN